MTEIVELLTFRRIEQGDRVRLLPQGPVYLCLWATFAWMVLREERQHVDRRGVTFKHYGEEWKLPAATLAMEFLDKP
jgi:hypothetical protein